MNYKKLKIVPIERRIFENIHDRKINTGSGEKVHFFRLVINLRL